MVLKTIRFSWPRRRRSRASLGVERRISRRPETYFPQPSGSVLRWSGRRFSVREAVPARSLLEARLAMLQFEPRTESERVIPLALEEELELTSRRS